MGKEWTADLAKNIKEKNREAAEEYGREQHRVGIITDQGRPFFSALVTCLHEDVSEIKRQLQGDATSAETTIQTVSPTVVKIARSRFPWFDAHISHHDGGVVLEYAKGRGTAGDPSLDRKSCHFEFRVAGDDGLSVQEAFSDNPHQFQKPEELSRHILQTLFQV